MINPLFSGFVAFVIRNADNQQVSTFQSNIRESLEELEMAEEVESVEWYDELHEYWLTVLDEDTVEEYLQDFVTLVRTAGAYQLMLIATNMRNEIVLESQPDLTYRLAEFKALYTFQWEDGLQIAYSCNPTMRSSGATFDPELINTLTGIFNQQLTETLISPGLDALHDQIAKPFDQNSFRELLGLMENHANKKPAAEREAFENIIFRIKQAFSFNTIVCPDKEVKVEWLSNGGGF